MLMKPLELAEIWCADPCRIWNAEDHTEMELDQCWPVSAADPLCRSRPVLGRCALRNGSGWRTRDRSVPVSHCYLVGQTCRKLTAFILTKVRQTLAIKKKTKQ